MDNKKKTLAIVLGIFALVIVTTAASFAFFTYSRTGNTKATIISGDIEFSYIEGESASLTNAFPVKDEIGAIDESGEYDFQVKLNSSGTTSANYNVYLVDNNNSTNHFTNEQIKFALIKNNVYVANTSATEGVKLSSINGFQEGSYNGEGLVLEDQEIFSGEVDNYKLRIWISDDVSYTNEYQSDGTMTGKYNSYTYSLKVKVTSGIKTLGKVFKNKEEILADFTGNSEAVMCDEYTNGYYHNCKESTLADATSNTSDSIIILKQDTTLDSPLRFEQANSVTLDMNGYDLALGDSIVAYNNELNIVDDSKNSILSSNVDKAILQIGFKSVLNVRNINMQHNSSVSGVIWFNSNSNGSTVTLNNTNIQSIATAINSSDSGANNKLIVENSKIICDDSYAINANKIAVDVKNSTLKSTNKYAIKINNIVNINNSYVHSDNDAAIVAGSEGIVTIDGSQPTFDENGDYASGTYLSSYAVNTATLYLHVGGKIIVNGGKIYHNAATNGTWRQHALRLDGGTAYLNGGTFISDTYKTEEYTGDDRTIYLTSNSATLNVKNATIDGAIYLNHDTANGNPNTYAYICSGSVGDLKVTAGSTARVKSSGITWGTLPTFGTSIIQDDTITCD